MLFAGWEVRIVKNCDRGLQNPARGRRPRAAFSSPRSQFFTIRTDPKPVNNLFILFQPLKPNEKKTHGKNTHASVTVTVVRDRKILTALRTNQIARFVTVPAWKEKEFILFLPLKHKIHILSSIYARMLWFILIYGYNSLNTFEAWKIIFASIVLQDELIFIRVFWLTVVLEQSEICLHWRTHNWKNPTS